MEKESDIRDNISNAELFFDTLDKISLIFVLLLNTISMVISYVVGDVDIVSMYILYFTITIIILYVFRDKLVRK